jgi:predicted MFS family arabinose efflux permease
VRDLHRILSIQAVRAVAYGFGAVLIGSSLAAAGASGGAVALVCAAMLAGQALGGVAVGTRGDRWGRRRTYAGLFALMAGAGTVFALTASIPALVAAALTGTISTEANESGPITSLEQAMIPHAEPDSGLRNRAFARYNAVAFLAGSVGALAAGGPSFFRRFFPAVPANQRCLLALPVAAVACAVLATRLSPAVEGGEEQLSAARGFPLVRSRSVVTKLSALFAVDAFAGGFVVQSFLAYWFVRRYGVSTEALGLVFFATGILQGISALAAAPLANRIGLVRTMVFTHLPSNVLLALIPFAGSFGGSVALLLARSAISLMDVPARQAFVVSIVEPDERTAAAAYTNTARAIVRPAGAGVGGAITSAWLAGSFVVAGMVKVLYDLLLLATFGRTGAGDDPVSPIIDEA